MLFGNKTKNIMLKKKLTYGSQGGVCLKESASWTYDTPSFNQQRVLHFCLH